MTAPVPTPQYRKFYNHISLSTSRYAPPKIITKYVNTTVNNVAPITQAPLPVPIPSPIAPQPLESVQSIPPQVTQPVPMMQIVPEQQVVQPVIQQPMISQVPFAPQVDEHYVRNYPIWENDPRRQLLSSNISNPNLSTSIPGVSVNPALVQNASLPGVNASLHGVNTSLPGFNASLPGVNASIPGVNTSLPGVNLPNL